MTDVRGIDLETLNAYVDGELDVSRAADIAAAVARDAGLAARVATLARVKAATSELGKTGSSDMRWSPPRRTWRGARAIAASIAVALLAGAGFAFVALTGPGEPVWLTRASAAHERWLAMPVGTASPHEVNREGLLQQAGQVGMEHLPDLADAQLRQVWIAPTRGRRGAVDGLYVGYVGVHGCRLGLWTGRPEAGFPDRFESKARPHLTAYAWQVDGLAYVVLARGMDAERLRLLAATIERLTRQRERLDDETRTALREAPLTGTSCIG